MTRIWGIATALVVVGLLGAGYLFFTAPGQDALLGRGVQAGMARGAPPAPDGLRVFMCGTSSPLPAPDRDQACVVAGINTACELDRGYRVAHHGPDLLPPELGVMEARVIEPGVVLDEDGLRITAFPVDHSPVALRSGTVSITEAGPWL